MTSNTKPFKTIQTTKDLGQIIREIRKSKGLTIQAVSGLANTSPRFLSELERGKETAEIGKVLKVLRTLGLDIVIKDRSSRPVSGREK